MFPLTLRRPPLKTKLPFAFGLALMVLSPPTASFALDGRLVASLKELDPSARLEQRCDLEAMNRIAKDKKGYSPERVVAAATAEIAVDGDTLKSDGAAFRSKGRWYHLTFVCATSDDHMEVSSFDYSIGAEIPQAHWEEYGLYE